MIDSHGNELEIGDLVIVSGEQDGKSFACNFGSVVEYVGGRPWSYVTIRFADWHEGHGVGNGEWCFLDRDRSGWKITKRVKEMETEAAQVGPSTYLNGLVEPAPTSDRPRFMTAWMVDDDDPFRPTGNAFLSLEDAEASARETLQRVGNEDQIAVLEIRSVHMARLVINSEAA